MRNRFNVAAYFVLPLTLEKFNTVKFGEYNVINVFVSPDMHSAIVQTERIPTFMYRSRESYMGEWMFLGNKYVEFAVMPVFYGDVRKIMEGKYSQVSEKAKMRIRQSVDIRQIEDEDNEIILKELDRRSRMWPHAVGYRTKNRTLIVPDIYAVMVSKDNPLYKTYKSNMEAFFGVKFKDDLELYDKPDLEKEIINEDLYKAVMEVKKSYEKAQLEG